MKNNLVDKALNKEKLDLTKCLTAIDMRERFYYDNLLPEQQKKYVPLVLMRFLSSASNQNGLHEYYLTMINEIVNQDFWTLTKFPDLQHRLMAIVGLGKKIYHEWIPVSKKLFNEKLYDFVKIVNPNMNDLEFKVFIKITSEESFVKLAKDYALSDKEIKVLVEQFKNAKSK